MSSVPRVFGAPVPHHLSTEHPNISLSLPLTEIITRRGERGYTSRKLKWWKVKTWRGKNGMSPIMEEYLTITYTFCRSYEMPVEEENLVAHHMDKSVN